MEQPVQNGRCRHLILGKDLNPVPNGAIGINDSAAFHVPGARKSIRRSTRNNITPLNISTINKAINALKCDYGTMLKKKFIYEVKRLRKDKKLPVVLSKEEVAKILNSVHNLKHRAILMLVHSAGLRVGEVVRLKTEDIDSKGMLNI
jgi:integrase